MRTWEKKYPLSKWHTAVNLEWKRKSMGQSSSLKDKKAAIVTDKERRRKWERKKRRRKKTLFCCSICGQSDFFIKNENSPFVPFLLKWNPADGWIVAQQQLGGQMSPLVAKMYVCMLSGRSWVLILSFVPPTKAQPSSSLFHFSSPAMDKINERCFSFESSFFYHLFSVLVQ